ncbi:MAG TPA: GNAT family N-acetyltransferase [Pilimelia sp.]|nr:GNAT family N-acetyltransferase [Pilimelia sp.]
MTTEVLDVPAYDRYELRVGGDLAGYALYQRTDGVVSVLHTEVEPEYEGRGLGSVLARGVLDGIRAAGESVLPRCPFLRRYLQRHDGYADLVPAADRARFGLAAPA